MDQTINIPLSKTKIGLLFLGALVFVGLGIWFMASPETFQKEFIRSQTKVILVGSVGILFFGLCSVFLFKKLFDKKFGFIISDTGFTDNSSAIAAGQVLWSDIKSIRTIKVYNQILIAVNVTNPDMYIDRQKSKLKKRAMKMNKDIYGTPLQISANGLKISFDELYSILKHRLDNHCKNNAH